MYQYIKKREKRRKSKDNIILFSKNVEYIFECIKKCVKIEHVLEARTTTREFQIIQKKLLTVAKTSDKIKKSLEGDKIKWSLKIEQIKYKVKNQQFFMSKFLELK